MSSYRNLTLIFEDHNDFSSDLNTLLSLLQGMEAEKCPVLSMPIEVGVCSSPIFVGLRRAELGGHVLLSKDRRNLKSERKNPIRRVTLTSQKDFLYLMKNFWKEICRKLSGTFPHWAGTVNCCSICKCALVCMWWRIKISNLVLCERKPYKPPVSPLWGASLKVRLEEVILCLILIVGEKCIWTTVSVQLRHLTWYSFSVTWY